MRIHRRIGHAAGRLFLAPPSLRQRIHRSLRGLRAPGLLGGLAAAVVGISSGCIPDNHPLDKNGTVTILLESSQPLYAADVLDEWGNPVLPRQVPYEKAVQLSLEHQGQADEGAYVDVRIEPPQALRLVPTVDDSCRQLAGEFRCRAGEDGTANFVVRSESDWADDSGAKITFAGRTESKTIDILPAGLPTKATNFGLIIGGLKDSSKVQATHSSLKCHLGPVPDEVFDKWPAGKIRVRSAVARAIPPAGTPTVVEHAPVIIQSQHAEAAISRDPSCNERDSLLRVQLNALGESPEFYLCFSDIGGSDVKIGFYSGQKTSETPKTLQVDPEPRLLRVLRTTLELYVGDADTKIAELAAYDAELNPLAMKVDVYASDPTVLQIGSIAQDLPANVTAQKALAAGTSTIRVTPQLYSTPMCESDPITIVEP